MEGLEKFADEHGLTCVYGTGKDTFQPVCTTFALQTDLAVCPKGNFVPSPFFRGPDTPIDVSWTYIIAMGEEGAVLSDTNGDQVTLDEGDAIQYEDGDEYTVVSGWVKTTLVTNSEVHEQWKKCFTKSKKLGTFAGIKDNRTKLKGEFDASLFPLPTPEEVSRLFGKLVESPQTRMEYQEKIQEYEELLEKIKDIHSDIWSKPGFKSKQDACKKAMDKYNDDGKKPTDLKHFSENIVKLKDQLDKAVAAQKASDKLRDAMVDKIAKYYELIESDDYPKDSKALGQRRKPIDSHLTKLGVDRETCKATNCVKDTVCKELLFKIDAHAKATNDEQDKRATIANSGGSKKRKSTDGNLKPNIKKPSQVVKVVNKVKERLSTWQPLAAKHNDQEKIERLSELMNDAKEKAMSNEEYDVAEIYHLVKYFTELTEGKVVVSSKDKSTTTGKGRCKECESKKTLIDKGRCFDCLNDTKFGDRIGIIQNKLRDYKKFATPEQRQECEQGIIRETAEGIPELVKEPVRGQFDQAYDDYETKRGLHGSYDDMCKVLERAEEFFKDINVKDRYIDSSDDNEDDDSGSGSMDCDEEEEEEDEEEDDEEDEESSFSSSHDNRGRKRSRDEDMEEIIDLAFEAMIKGTEDDRKQVNKIRKQGNRDQLKAISQEVIKRNQVNYKVHMTYENGSPLSSELVFALKMCSCGALFDDKEEAESAASLFIENAAKGNVMLKYEIEKIHPNEGIRIE